MKLKYFVIIFLFLNLPVCASVLVISSPGDYVLNNDIYYTPSNSPSTAILIKANNVVLDFNGHEIFQSNAAGQVSGVVIAAGYKNITVKNGMIAQFTDQGILINAGCENINVESIAIKECAKAITIGSPIAPVKQLRITDISITDCCQSSLNQQVITLQSVQDFECSHFICSQNGGISHPLEIIRISDCNFGRFNDIKIDRTFGSHITGFVLSGTKDTAFNNCTLHESVTLNGTIIGYHVVSNSFSNNNSFNRCACTSNSMNAEFVTGFTVGNNNNDNSFFSCLVANNNAAQEFNGFACSQNNRTVLKKCISSHNVASQGVSRGFWLNNVNQQKIISCESFENVSLNDAGFGFDISFAKNCFFFKNIAMRNAGKNNSFSFGFNVNPASPIGDNVFLKNISIQNGTIKPFIMANQFKGFWINQQNVQNSDNSNGLVQAWSNAGLI